MFCLSERLILEDTYKRIDLFLLICATILWFVLNSYVIYIYLFLYIYILCQYFY